MKFQPDRIDAANVVSSHEPGKVRVGDTTWEQSLVVPWHGTVQPWQVTGFETLDGAAFERLAALAPELVIFGSGARLRFPRPEWLRPLIERRIGFETMDTAAACRTYNVLVSEGRSVLAALLIEPRA